MCLLIDIIQSAEKSAKLFGIDKSTYKYLKNNLDFIDKNGNDILKYCMLNKMKNEYKRLLKLYNEKQLSRKNNNGYTSYDIARQMKIPIIAELILNDLYGKINRKSENKIERNLLKKRGKRPLFVYTRY